MISCTYVFVSSILDIALYLKGKEPETAWIAYYLISL